MQLIAELFCSWLKHYLKKKNYVQSEYKTKNNDNKSTKLCLVPTQDNTFDKMNYIIFRQHQ